MDELLATLFAMPTLPWTCLVLASVVYWLTVIVGAIDLDVLGSADGHGAMGHGHDVGDVGHADGADGHGLADGAAAKEGVLSALMSALKLRSVPVTISLSFLGLFGWIVSYLLTKNLVPHSPLPTVATQTLVFVLSLATSLVGTSASVRPLAPLFAKKQGTKHRDLVGKVVRITTGRVDGKFGEGHLDDGAAGLQLQVRCADPDALARDDEALILGWDPKTESFEVEPMSTIDGNAQKRGRSAGSSGKPT
jgi:hypothetical protein